MKKIVVLMMVAVFGILFPTSCTHEELDSVLDSDMANVTFSLGVQSTPGTKSISDGLKATKLVYAVYDADKQLLPELGKTETLQNSIVGSDNAHEVVITLAKGQTYYVAFWAQNPDCDAYDTDDLTAVKVNYSGVNNDENRDAFFKTVEVQVSGNKKVDVSLKRPFAQINVGVTEADWNAAKKAGVELETSEVVIKNAATSLNLLTGEVDDVEDVTYALSKFPSELLCVDTDNDDTNEEYKWLSMSYILVADESATGSEKANLNSLKYTFEGNGKTIVIDEGLTNVPVQRNWRTNIIGKLLTGDLTFKIYVDKSFDAETNLELPFPVATWDEFTAALAAGEDNLIFTKDISYDNSYDLKKDVIIDLNGKSFTIDKPDARLNIGLKNSNINANVTIKNGTLNCKVYAQLGNVILTDIKFGGTIAYTGDAQGVITVGNANLAASNCDMSNVTASAPDKRPRALSTEGLSSGYLKLIDCNFPSGSDGTGAFVKTKLLRTYINPLSGNAQLEISRCRFGVAANIDLAASYVWNNMNLTKSSGGFTFTISRASTSLTTEELAVYRAIKSNNTGTMRFLFSDGEKNSL